MGMLGVWTMDNTGLHVRYRKRDRSQTSDVVGTCGKDKPISWVGVKEFKLSYHNVGL